MHLPFFISTFAGGIFTRKCVSHTLAILNLNKLTIWCWRHLFYSSVILGSGKYSLEWIDAAIKNAACPRRTRFLREIYSQAELPVYAIGGIQLETVKLIEGTGCGAAEVCMMLGMMEL